MGQPLQQGRRQRASRSHRTHTLQSSSHTKTKRLTTLHSPMQAAPTTKSNASAAQSKPTANYGAPSFVKAEHKVLRRRPTGHLDTSGG